MANIQGLERTIEELNGFAKGIKFKTLKGMTKAAMKILEDTERTPPLTPLDTGNLRSSRFIVSGKKVNLGESSIFKGDESSKIKGEHKEKINNEKQRLEKLKYPAVSLGYTAYYAPIVHEMVGNYTKPINWSRPNSGAKFLEKSIKRNKKEILKIIKEEASVKQVVKEMNL